MKKIVVLMLALVMAMTLLTACTTTGGEVTATEAPVAEATAEVMPEMTETPVVEITAEPMAEASAEASAEPAN